MASLESIIDVESLPAEFESSPTKDPYTRVTLYTGATDEETGESIYYTAGTDDGLTLEINCMWATQQMANNILTIINGHKYRSFTSSDTFIDPSFEIGDCLKSNGKYGGIFEFNNSFNDELFISTLSSPDSSDIEDEFKFEDPSTTSYNRKFNELETSLSVMAGLIESKVSYVEVETVISQSLNSIKLNVKNNDKSSTIELKHDGITISSGEIDFTGTVTFNDLETSGSTVINGSNITTGTISAERLNLTGAISWGDLSDSAKEEITTMISSDIPSYIHTTYIDDVSIYSPKIYGAQITAGTSSDGYIQMLPTGMSFISERGGQLITMGYASGKHLFPYITVGAGLNEYGQDRGMIKKYGNGIWIGDSDGIEDSVVGEGTGIFIDFVQNKIYKYLNGTRYLL